MAENIKVTTERVDDVPVLISQAQRLKLAELVDEHYPMHGNWLGTSMGWTVVVWLVRILSEGDHRLNSMQAWAEERRLSLSQCLGQAVSGQAWSDDRLGLVLDALGDTERWSQFETALNRRTFRVYDLKPKRVRVDSTTASGYWSVTEEGLFQYGHSKDHRPDLPQLKVMLSALDPLGMPVATQVVSGERADDRLYIPAIQQVSASLEAHGLLYVGDCKMAALGTRAFIAAQDDFYLCPLAEQTLPQATLERYLQPVWNGQQAVTPVVRPDSEGQGQKVAEGYELTVPLSAPLDDKAVNWTERRLVVRSMEQARSKTEALQERLDKAQVELAALNETKQGKKRLSSIAEMQAAAQRVLKANRVEGMVKLNITETSQERSVRSYADYPARTQTERTLSLQFEIDRVAVQQAVRCFGWRVYVTNQPQESLPFEQAILAYREEFIVERSFSRLKGKSLALSPMYLQSDRRATGLVRLLALGLRLLTLLEHQARKRLAEQNQKLAGLYAGNPKRSTSRPTAEALLQAFKGIHLSVVTMGEQVLRHVTPLSEVQQQILELLDLPVLIYSQLAGGFSKTAE